MKRIIKHNLVLLIVLSVALLIAIGLLVLVIIEHARMNNYFSRARELRGQIEELIKQETAPVAGNIEPIKAETELYRKKAQEIKRYFGRVKQPALDAFAKTLGMTYPEFHKAFQEAWEADPNRHALGGRDRFYVTFKRKFPQWEAAIKTFAAEYQKVTVEPITMSNRDEILLSALGVPRNMNNNVRDAMNHISKMRSRLIEIFNEKGGENKVELTGTASSFSFDNTVPPLPETIPAIVRNLDVIGDLASRIAASGLNSLDSFKKRSLAGERVGDYVIYHYTFAVSGDIDVVRKLVTDLHGAMAENRFYVVRSVFLYAPRDGAGEIFDARQAEEERLRMEVAAMAAPAAANAAGRPGMMMDPMMPEDPAMGGAPGRPVLTKEELAKQEAQRREELMKLPYNERPGYGRVLFGGTKHCEAVIDVDYIALAEPELN